MSEKTPDFSLSHGKILKDSSSAKRYRILAVDEERTVLCEMDISKNNTFPRPTDEVFRDLEEGIVTLCEDMAPAFDLDKCTEDVVRRFNLYRKVFSEVDEEYGPDYLRLNGNGKKPQLKAILEKYDMKPSTFNPLLVRYLQSGARESSLLDRRSFGPNKGKTYDYTKKTGRPSKHEPDMGIPLSPEVYEHFDAAIKWMKGEGRKKRMRSIRSAYIWMCRHYYFYTECVNGNVVKHLLPITERPTEPQFRGYVEKTISKMDMAVIRTSAREVQNNERNLNSGSSNGAAGPGDILECDACELPVSLVSGINPDRTIGGPTLYIFVDPLTRTIPAYSLGIEQNSVLGITGLFLNLVDDKQEFCAKHGIYMERETVDGLFPSNYLPRQIRCDRGAEFTSDEMERICNELHIKLDFAPPAMGSAKGVVEHLFDEIMKAIDPYLEGHGRITKRHDSTHHQDACLTFHELSKIILNVILAHNKRKMLNYRTDPELDREGVRPRPAELWKYYVKTCGAPRPIRDVTSFVQTVMTEIDAKVSRDGILYKGLWYLADDPVLEKERSDAGTRRVPFEPKTFIDMRCVGAIYYLRGETLMRASLKNKDGNIKYKEYTMVEWRDHLDALQKDKVEGKSYNDQVDADLADAEEVILESAKKPTKSITKGMTGERHAEKQRVNAENKAANRLPDVMPGDFTAPAESAQDDDAPQDEEDYLAYTDFGEALEDFNENR